MDRPIPKRTPKPTGNRKQAHTGTVSQHPARPNMLFFAVSAVILFILIIVTYTVVTSRQELRSRAAYTGPVLTMNPPTRAAVVGETFPLALLLNTNGTMVSAVALRISYDPTAVVLSGFSPGTDIPILLTQPSIGSSTLSVDLGVQPTTPFTGSTVLGTVQVRILAEKQSDISYTATTKVAVIGQNTNALESATGASVSGGTTILPSPTNSSNRRPTHTPRPKRPEPTKKPKPNSSPPPFLMDDVDSVEASEGEPDMAYLDAGVPAPDYPAEETQLPSTPQEKILTWIRTNWIHLFKTIFPGLTE